MKSRRLSPAFTQKIIILLSLAFLPLGTRPLTAQNCAEQGSTSLDIIGHVTADDVRIREKPCVASKSLGFLKIGTAIYCKKKSKEQQQIGKDKNNWFHCSLDMDQGGWIFGAFIKEGKFDTDAHLATLPEAKNVPGPYKKLIGTGWSDCKPNEDAGRGCETIYFGAKTISFDLNTTSTYHIRDITEKKGTLYLKAVLLFSNMPVTELANTEEFVITFTANDSMIKVNDHEYYH